MAIEFNWHDDQQTIIRLDMIGDSTWEQYHAAIAKVVAALESTPKRLDVIINDPGAKMPPGTPMPHIKATASRLAAYPHMGVIVVVGNRSGNRLVQTLVNVVYRIYGIDTRIIGDFVGSIEAAEASIAQLRARDAATNG